MASKLLPLAISLSISLFFVQGVLGEIVCEDLPKEMCSFSVASSGKRCLLENYAGTKAGETEYQCRTSEVVVERMSNWIETDECVNACGVDRNAVGISSDALLEPQFTHNLCSPSCFNACPNIVDLYFNLAAGEGVFLPDLCEVQRSNPHRAMAEILSSGVASGPVPATPGSLLAGGGAPSSQGSAVPPIAESPISS